MIKMKTYKTIERSIIISMLFLMSTQISAQSSQEKKTEKDSEEQLQGNQDKLLDVAYGEYKSKELSGAVSTINETEVTKNAVNTIEQALNGTLSGLYSKKDSGDKMGFSNYDFFVRGVATTGHKSPLILVDGVDANINLIDPKEVESITVLKDATELAMYGMRGANGVILIKTKRGKIAKDFVQAEIKSGVQAPQYISGNPNAYEYAILHNEANINDGNTPIHTPDNYLNNVDPNQYPDTNFRKLFLRNSTQTLYQNYRFTAGGGNDFAQYFCLVGYMKQGGLFSLPINYDGIKQTSNERYNFRTNLDMNLGNGFALKTNIAAVSDERNAPRMGSNSVNSANDALFSSIMNTPSYAYPLINPDGSYAGNSEYQNNILGILRSGSRRENTRQLSVKVDFSKDLSSIVEGLKANVVYNFENYNSFYKGKYTRFAVYDLQENGSYTKYGVDDTKVTTEGGQLGDYYNYKTVMGGLNYANTFGDHDIKASLVANQFTRRVSGDTPDYRWAGTSGRVIYGFKNRYYGDISGAYQGSNNFARGKRYGFFPSAGFSWILSNEDFLKDNTIVKYLKLRSSYGIVGSDMTNSRFMYRQPFYKSGGYGFGNPNGSATGVSEGILGNLDATWEKAYKTNVGVDASLFNNSFMVSADYFHESRKDILVSQSNNVPNLIGVDLPLYNAGVVNNQGVELQVNYAKKIGELEINVGGNLTYAKSNVQDLKEIAYSPEEQYRYRKGNTVDSFFGLVADGIYNSQADIDADGVVSTYGALKPGDIKYMDLNQDGIINDADKKVIGNSLPKMFYGVNLGFKYGGFDFYCVGEGASMFDTNIKPKQFSKYVYDNRWTSSTGSSNSLYPRVSLESSHNSQTSTFWNEKGRLFRLATIELGYTLPSEATEKLSISKLRIFFNGDNVFSTTSAREGRDFEASAAGYSQYPILKTYLFGLSINL